MRRKVCLTWTPQDDTPASSARARAAGQADPLKRILAGYGSRRITDEHQLVYRVEGDGLFIAQLRFHD